MTFLHYARHRPDIPYAAELDELSARHPSYYQHAEAYVCGPPGLIETTRVLWARDGHEERVHSESFLSTRVVATSGGARLAGQVRNVNIGELSSCENGEIQICVSAPAHGGERDL